MTSEDPNTGRLRGPIVVGYDDHASSRRALRYAVDLTAGLDVTMRVLHVVNLEDFPVDPDSSSWDEQMRRHEDLLVGHVGALIDLPDEQWSYAIVRGDPWHALVAEADKDDALMIVVGQHTHAHLIAGAVVRLLGGGTSSSVAGALIRRGHRPVLVVPSLEDEA